MKNTSKQSYKECKESGYMTAKELEVYNAIKEHGPLLGVEINRVTGSHSNHKRLIDMARKGYIKEGKQRRDELTGKPGIEWSIAPDGYVPHQEGEKPTKATLEALLAHYEDGRVSSAVYNEGYIAGWTACINSLQGAVPVRFCVPPKDWE